MKSGTTRFSDGKSLLGTLLTEESESKNETKMTAMAVGGNDLLDMFSSTSQPPPLSPQTSGSVTNQMHIPQPVPAPITRTPAARAPASVEYDIFGDVIQTPLQQTHVQSQPQKAQTPILSPPPIPLLAPPISKAQGSSNTIAPLLPPPPGSGMSAASRSRVRTASNPPPVAPAASVDLFDSDFLVPVSAPALVQQAPAAVNAFDDLSAIASRPSTHGFNPEAISRGAYDANSLDSFASPSMLPINPAYNPSSTVPPYQTQQQEQAPQSTSQNPFDLF